MSQVRVKGWGFGRVGEEGGRWGDLRSRGPAYNGTAIGLDGWRHRCVNTDAVWACVLAGVCVWFGPGWLRLKSDGLANTLAGTLTW